MQNEEAVNGFLNPHLPQVIAFPYRGRRNTLIAIARREIAKMIPSASSNGGFCIPQITTVEVVELCARVVRVDVVHGVVEVVVKTLMIVRAPV